MVELDHLNQLIHPAFKETEDYIDAKISTGLAASPGCAVGRVAFSSEDVLEMKKANPKKSYFVPRRAICRRCFRHARVQWFLDAKWWDDVARCRRRSRMGLTVRFGASPTISGRRRRKRRISTTAKASPANLIATVKSGDWISLVGGEGYVINRKVKMNAAGEGVCDQYPKMAKFMGWVEEAKSLSVYANADTAAELKLAMYFGAQGIGLLRAARSTCS